MRIGTDFYEEEYNKWPDSPCISNSEIRDDYWEIMLDDQGIPETTTYESFDATVAYKVGEVVSYGLSNQMGYFLYK